MSATHAPAASLTGVVKHYGKQAALDDLTLRIEPGTVTALLGPNGAGKSTAVALLLGLTRAIEARESLWQVVRELTARGCAILLTTHYLEEAQALAQRVAVLARGRIVSEGTVDEIRARGLSRRIRCATTLAVEEVRTWPGVSAAAREQGWLNIESAAAEPVVRRLLAADPHLSGLEVRGAGLAEAFVRITREAA